MEGLTAALEVTVTNWLNLEGRLLLRDPDTSQILLSK
jgi:hypothetical protein